MLQDIVSEVLNEMLVEEASAYMLDEPEPGLELDQAVRNAVVKRLEWLDANFLAALNAYLSVPSVQADSQLAELLGAVRREVLDLVAARLPAPVQVLNAALGHSSRAQRAEVVQLALAGGSGSLPGTSLDALGAAALQLVDDMEDQQVVADRALLARLVLVREELQGIAEQQTAEQFFGGGLPKPGRSLPEGQEGAPGSGAHGAGGFFAFQRANLPAHCAAFVKELLAVPERHRRLALLTKAFQEDWVGESPLAGVDAATGQQQQRVSRSGLRNVGSSDQGRPESLDIVRPGRFFSTLHAMRSELEQQFEAAGNLEAGALQLSLLRNLEDIRLEALAVLDRIQWHRGGAAGGGVAGAVGGPDYEVDLLGDA